MEYRMGGKFFTEYLKDIYFWTVKIKQFNRVKKTEDFILLVWEQLYSFSGGTSGTEPACQCRNHKKCRFDPSVRKIPWRRVQKPTPIFLPGESLGQRSLVVHSITQNWTWLKRLSTHTNNSESFYKCESYYVYIGRYYYYFAFVFLKSWYLESSSWRSGAIP